MVHPRSEIAEPLVTLEEFQRMPEEDAYRIELVRGRIVREPRPGAAHGWVTGRLVERIGSYAREHGLGIVVTETGFLLSVEPPTVRGPDLAFLAAESLPPELPTTGFWRLAPDLAVEVVSPSNTAAEIREKVLEYLASGSRLVWVVDPATRSVSAYRSRRDISLLTEDDALEGGDVLPGFRLPIAELLERTRRPGRRTP
jgi:Uma2 family endonuclease